MSFAGIPLPDRHQVDGVAERFQPALGFERVVLRRYNLVVEADDVAQRKDCNGFRASSAVMKSEIMKVSEWVDLADGFMRCISVKVRPFVVTLIVKSFAR